MAIEESKLREAITTAMKQEVVDPGERESHKAIRRGSRWEVFFHPDVDEATEKQPIIRRRVALIMRHLAAHGRTAILKGCTEPENKGWLRAPAGGNTGNQFYLWFQITGDQIWIRALRHHDDHTPLKLGDPEDYLEMPSETIRDKDWFEQPWSEAQNDAIDCTADCISLIGMPGAGKTSAAWERIIRKTRRRALYLTYSRELAEHAREYFRAFIGDDQEVIIRSAHDLIGEISGRPVHPGVVREQRMLLAKLSGMVASERRGRWGRIAADLYAELRGRYLGLAPLSKNSKWQPGQPGRLPPGEYLERFSADRPDRKERAEVLMKSAAALERTGGLKELFPDLTSAAQARRRIRQGFLPAGLGECDLVVLDEAQDLTIAEMAVITDLIKAIGKASGRRPSLMIAGDESQTIRPTAFEWRYVHDLMYQEGLGKAREIIVQGNQRCPKAIAEVIDRATTLYKTLGKGHRPSHASAVQIVPASNGKVRLVCEKAPGAVVKALSKLADMPGVVVVSPSFEKPTWMPSELWAITLTPESVKGLEYQTVVAVDPLNGIQGNEDGESGMRNDVAIRTDIDRLRVCLSRATETIVGMTVGASPDAESRTRDLFDGAIEMSIAALMEEIRTEDISPEERVMERIDRSAAILRSKPFQALKTAGEGLHLLGDRTLPGGVMSEGVRHKVAENFLLALAAAVFVRVRQRNVESGSVGTRPADDLAMPDKGFLAWADAAVERLTTTALVELGAESEREHVARLAAAALQAPIIETAAMFYLAVFRAGFGRGDWFDSAANRIGHDLAEDLFRALGHTTEGAKIAAELDAPGFVDQMFAISVDPVWEIKDTLISLAVERLIHVCEYAVAEQAIERHLGNDPVKLAAIKSKQKRFKEAAILLEEGGRPKDALEAWRMAGCIEIATKKTQGRLQKELGWLLRLEAMMREVVKPKILAPAEKERLDAALQSLKTLAKNTSVMTTAAK